MIQLKFEWMSEWMNVDEITYQNGPKISPNMMRIDSIEFIIFLWFKEWSELLKCFKILFSSKEFVNGSCQMLDVVLCSQTSFVLHCNFYRLVQSDENQN